MTWKRSSIRRSDAYTFLLRHVERKADGELEVVHVDARSGRRCVVVDTERLGDPLDKKVILERVLACSW